MKTCTKCGFERTFDEFSKRSAVTSGYSSWCKECHKKLKDQHYLDNKADYITKAKQRQAEMAVWFDELKKNLQCCKCGQDHPATLDFHHRDPNQKDFQVSDFKDYSKETVLEEIAKCDVLCANCHRIHHWNERPIRLLVRSLGSQPS